MATLRALPGPIAGMTATAFPAAAQLAALGPVLCLYRTQHGSELAGWQQAVRVEAHTGVDSDGLDERLLFYDAQGRCCWPPVPVAGKRLRRLGSPVVVLARRP